jgi:DNA repair protein RecO (recombination protein O)
VTLVASDATVLHAFSYLESSRILRLATRDAGVVSVMAKGARRASRRFGTGVDLFVEGQAQFYAKPGRELHTLGAFDVTRTRTPLATDLERFTAASAIAELVLRFGREDPQPELYDTLVAALDGVAEAPVGFARTAGLSGAWRLVAELGFAPTMESCASCHTPLSLNDPAAFGHPVGGSLCDGCARATGARRYLPPEARTALASWLSGSGTGTSVDDPSARAHQRLLREFLREHLADGRPLRAFEAWESDRWVAASSIG